MFASFCFHAYYLDGRGKWQLLSCPVGLHGQFLPSQPIPRFFPPFVSSFFLWRPLVQMAPLVVWLVVGAVALIQPSSIKFWGGQRLRSHKDVCFWSLTCEAVQWTSVIRGFVWKVMPAFFFIVAWHIRGGCYPCGCGCWTFQKIFHVIDGSRHAVLLNSIWYGMRLK